MEKRTEIATAIAAGLFDGVPISSSDIFDRQTPEQLDEAKKVCKAVAQISVMMADALLEELNVQVGIPKA